MNPEKEPAFDHTGSSFDSFLDEEGIRNEVEATAIDRVTAWQLSESARRKGRLQIEIAEMQRAFCKQQAAEYVAALGETKSGFAPSTKGLVTVNGLRHPTTDETTGWYIWCGEVLSDAPDFFAPLHTYHLYEEFPEIARLLGLSPGFRFLLAGDYLDVWYDASLLIV